MKRRLGINIKKAKVAKKAQQRKTHVLTQVGLKIVGKTAKKEA